MAAPGLVAASLVRFKALLVIGSIYHQSILLSREGSLFSHVRWRYMGLEFEYFITFLSRLKCF